MTPTLEAPAFQPAAAAPRVRLLPLTVTPTAFVQTTGSAAWAAVDTPMATASARREGDFMLRASWLLSAYVQEARKRYGRAHAEPTAAGGTQAYVAPVQRLGGNVSVQRA